MIVNQFKDWSEAELSSRDGLHHEVVYFKRVYFNVKSVDQEKGVRRGERHALVAVEERVIIASDSINAAASSATLL